MMHTKLHPIPGWRSAPSPGPINAMVKEWSLSISRAEKSFAFMGPGLAADAAIQEWVESFCAGGGR